VDDANTTAAITAVGSITSTAAFRGRWNRASAVEGNYAARGESMAVEVNRRNEKRFDEAGREWGPLETDQ
jgi:hypothetical protein